ncbi:NAD(P)-binding protein [Trametopsis cervina]|nr:NAD(P)-binding protein [Trametopsis cervina]
MPSYAITGGSRGLGLALVRALSADSDNLVFAIVRSATSAEQLHSFVNGHSHKNVHVIEADIGDSTTLISAAEQVAKVTSGRLDVLINNAAMVGDERSLLPPDGFPSPEVLEKDLVKFFRLNTIGPIHTINAFLPLLRAGTMKKCVNISSTVASHKITNAVDLDDVIGYGMSKAALNLANAKYAARFRGEGIVFLAVDPGLMKTMPPPQDIYIVNLSAKIRSKNPTFEGDITPDTSARDIVALINRATIADSGKFVHRDGTEADDV